MSQNKYCLVLAAGDGKRMKSDKPKVLLEVLFYPMLGWVLDAVQEAGVENIGVVVGNGKEKVEEYLASRGNYPTFTQSERKGTGHAVMMAKELIEKAAKEDADLMVACGDAPFIDKDTIEGSYAYHKEMNNDVTVVSAVVENPFGYGRIIKENSSFIGITEQKDCNEQQKMIKEINSGIYWFKAARLTSLLDALTCNNAANEYYLTDTVALAEKKGVYTAENGNVVLGANSRSQLSMLNRTARDMILDRLMNDGVDIPLTDGIIIGKDVKVGADTVILPGTILKGKTVIGKNCEIGPNSIIENCEIGNEVALNNVHAFDSVIDDDVKAGPYVHLRPGTKLHSKIRIGDFVEVKNSEIGVATCIAHLTYVGDSDVGKDVNFGCGCVTANYDGINKFRTVIGDHCFIGCNTNLVPPVKIGNNATTGAGSTITRDVPENALALERAETKIIENWEKNFKRKRKA